MNKKVTKILGLVFSIVFSFVLLESSGVDVAKANILKYDDFSFTVFILLVICMQFFDKLTVKSIDLASIFFSGKTSSSK